MKITTCDKMMREFARLTNSYLVVISGMKPGTNCNYPDYKIKGASYLDYDNSEHRDAIHDGQGIIICKTKDEAYKYFDQTIMDGIDNGIYAIVINRHGVVETENT